jgi:tRNA threonylcarbamoyladenosine biosynthesis protein TsaE
MSIYELYLNNLDELNLKAKIFIELITRNFKGINCIAFYGNMGSGKTTFIKTLCKELGVIDTVTSPTFAIINEYKAKDTILYHFDFYRIKKISEALDIGIEDYFDSGYYCFIEWPEIIEDLLPDNHIIVEIEEIENSIRKMTISKKI